ncbi:pyridoxamine 5'-phosphate oxidase [Leptospira inadai serovar Lyme str. 10]|uniref:Pyridoxine/pyridoxamine 5'-phosphate oxidase n=2 Tax=Leptospira inadai serovar Lyme TaxID=293084 RepID=V6HBQ5_9LEPT|nr:pyridoxamine 5'-phosphate oxidase [Leptospira inadai]EQA36887.1 pyridoxamine 5'-phosphate oxidase [Leptospira inadai serovar Lyme str. 10]PNV76440.1 pyridoxamine 5'-phosphate oxidase [Leptospira inadai serovar Lyme]
MTKNISELRNEYAKAELDESRVEKNPVDFFSRWFEEALHSEVKEPNAMTLATVDEQDLPNARIVLLKGISNGKFRFYTNYSSRKGEELEKHPIACLVFFWVELERQVRIRGNIAKVPREVSEAYFRTRPFASQIGALASDQSKSVADRTELEKKYNELLIRYEGKEVPLPPTWGGYELTPTEFEFWQGRRSRLHDRVQFLLRGDNWERQRLQP